MNKIKGLILTGLIAVIATVLGNFFPIIGGAVFAIIIGLLLKNTIGVGADFQPGIKLRNKTCCKKSTAMVDYLAWL
ncbi:putative sulfate exporter family transporter [Carnobacterium mobile]|uniref:putative sulfate exporter family transporter n=1 Tax=Carnobacterium mobile TaxID=2750 RepID=UPI0021F81056|nr:putative sulfate exporter family transporter [Carnobacterium mobile]